METIGERKNRKVIKEKNRRMTNRCADERDRRTRSTENRQK